MSIRHLNHALSVLLLFLCLSSAAPNDEGDWSISIVFPIVPVAAALVPGKVIVWSSYGVDQFGNSPGGYTQTSTWTLENGAIAQRTVSNTNHDMFCPGISLDFNGRPVVTGGNNNERTSIYDPASDSWISAANMLIGRGYQSQTTLSDGRIFTIGGSWSGAQGGKNGEVYDTSTNTWRALSSCPVAPMLTADRAGVYRSDNHAWLFSWSNGYVFQAGPSKAMNWYGTSGSGSRTAAGTRASDVDSMCGVAVMYDAVAGKIFTAGGSTSYDNVPAHTNAHVITIGQANQTPSVKKVDSMAYARAFHNGVVLPDGSVFVTGGQTFPVPFSDANSSMVPELWNPATEEFTSMAADTVPRNYHSVALLLPDATVFGGGGGLCGTCSTNHFDAEIFQPPYLFASDGSLATRPKIVKVLQFGKILHVETDTAISSWALVRYGSSTHTVNTDQRRIVLSATAIGLNYIMTIPSDPGVALPGYWMLFALNEDGVPSVSETIKV